MEVELTEGLIATAYSAIGAAATVVGFFLGLDISRLMATREGMLKSLAEFRNDARKAMYLEKEEVHADYFIAEQQIIDGAKKEANHNSPSVAAFATFAFSIWFLRYVLNEAGSAPTFQMPRILIWTGVALTLLQGAIFLYHFAVRYIVNRDIGSQQTLYSMLAHRDASFDLVAAKDEDAKKKLDVMFPDWKRLLNRPTPIS
jgi:hypothetical protein